MTNKQIIIDELKNEIKRIGKTMSLRADFMAQKRLDEEEKEIKTTNQLKTENEAIKIQQNPLTTGGLNPAQARLNSKYFKLKQTLAEIKPILEFYANSTIGTDKGNGVFEFEVFNNNVLGGKLICYYNTNPAREALRKISECEVDK